MDVGRWDITGQASEDCARTWSRIANDKITGQVSEDYARTWSRNAADSIPTREPQIQSMGEPG